MAEGYGGAKPKTRAHGRKTSSTTKSKRASDTSQFESFPQQNIVNGGIENHYLPSEERCNNINLSLTDTNENNMSNNNHFLKRVKENQRTNSKSGQSKSVVTVNGLEHSRVSYHSDDNLEGVSLQKLGKLSKEKEQVFLSAKERWKKSGLVLRKYIEKKLGFKQEDRTNKSFDPVKKQENDTKRKSDKTEISKRRNNLPRSRSENLKDEPINVMPRSKSFLRHFGFGKENGSSKVSQSGMKSSKSFDVSSSDAWPESSTDTCKSTSDWSADNTLTNHSSDYKIWTNRKCQGTQTKIPNSCSRGDKKGTKTEKTSECKHKSKSHKHSKSQKSSKDSKKECIKSDTSQTQNDNYVRKWVGLLDNDLPTSSDGEEEFEYVLDPDYGEIVRRAKTRKPRTSGSHSSSKNTDTGSRGSQEIRDSTYEALLNLQHAIPYLPESFRNRLQNTSADSGQTTLTASNSNKTGEITLKDSKVKTPREKTDITYSRTGDKKSQSSKNSSVEKLKQTKREEKNLKKLNKDKSNWKKRLNESDTRVLDRCSDSYEYDMIHDLERDLNNSLEDPFNVRSDPKIDLCSGLMDLVREIDIPFIDEEGDTKFDSFEKNHRHDEVNSNYSGVMPNRQGDTISNDNNQLGASLCDNSDRLSRYSNSVLNKGSGTRGTGPNQFVDIGTYIDKDGSPETSFDDDPDYPGMRTLNESFNRLLADDDTDTSTDSFVLTNFLPTSRSDESGSRSKSSDDSIEADDEFECECEHCQLLRQHSYGTSNLDLLPPRLYTDDMGFPYDLERSASGQTDTSRGGFRSSMFVDDYDFLMDQSGNELDWLIVDSRPLSMMLEDVIQQMLAVQPELLSEQAAPPAPQLVIDNLPTIPLTLSHIDQHPCCPICLCPCEVEELMTLLPCQHLFHPICIQAWLIKSGTCPVCRAKLNR